MPYVYRIIINGKTKEFETAEELLKFMGNKLKHPCFVNIRSFHPTKNIILDREITLRR